MKNRSTVIIAVICAVVCIAIVVCAIIFTQNNEPAQSNTTEPASDTSATTLPGTVEPEVSETVDRDNIGYDIFD